MGRRILHTMLRVGNMQRSIDFYTQALGMKFLRTCDFPEDQYTLAFLGFGTELEGSVIELTYNYGKETYDRGNAYGHICLGVDDVNADVARLKALGVNVTYESGDGFMAFITDPDGYEIELLNDKMMCQKAEEGMANHERK